MPIFFGLVLIFVIWFRFKSSKSTKTTNQDSSDFWRKEHAANMTRRADLNKITYLTIPFADLPLSQEEDSTLLACQEELHALGNVRILNLTGLTNTELKQRFGPANLEFLSQYEENYTRLCRLLDRWGTCLYEHERPQDALKVLSFAAQCKSDITSTYITIAKIYKDTGRQEDIDRLARSLNFFDTYRNEALQNSLSSIRNS